MLELVATIGMTAGSILLFGYWFRYTSLLILSAKPPHDWSSEFAAQNQLGFLEVQAQLRDASADLDRLQAALDRDYDIVRRLLKRSSISSAGEEHLESRMLDIDYRLMSAWACISRNFSLEASRRALEEMSVVIGYFANIAGEQAACSAQA
jgi:hypothetical protein